MVEARKGYPTVPEVVEATLTAKEAAEARDNIPKTPDSPLSAGESDPSSQSEDVKRCPDGPRSKTPDASSSAGESDPSSRSGKIKRDSRRHSFLSESRHKVVSYRGHAAATYMESVAAKHQIDTAKAPHRFEAVDGAARSVSVNFSSVGAAPPTTYSSEHPRRSVEVLDQSRREQGMLQLQQDEEKVTLWISAVTGHSSVAAAAAGEQSLQDALQSGEAFCDLINAVWPGRIQGILRGEVKPFRRVENILKFCRACTDLGMDETNLFAPALLAAGTESVRNVLRCLLALGALVPDPPGYEGPRLPDGSVTPRARRPSK